MGTDAAAAAAAATNGNNNAAAAPAKRSGSHGGLASCSDASRNMGNHLASRLVQLGVDTVFAVPGDYNLILLDQLIKDERLKVIYTCNELNAGYAADGYSRARRGKAACVVATFTVGGLSLLNAIAGAASESLPVICVTGGPNSNDGGTNRVLHHTIGSSESFNQEMEAFKPFVCKATRIFALEDAHWQLDDCIAEALRQSKPVYINIACNIAGLSHPTFEREPIPFVLPDRHTNPDSLEAAVETALELLGKAVKPVLVGGVKLRAAHRREAFERLAERSGFATAIMPNAKGMVSEKLERFMGVYWGQVSSPYCAETVESSDCYVFAGPVTNDYTSVGYSLLLKTEKMIVVDGDRVSVAGKRFFSCIAMERFLDALAERVAFNDAAWKNHQRMFVPEGPLRKPPADEPLITNVLYQKIQNFIGPESFVVAETGDSWFNCLKLKLPEGCGYEFQMQYGSIGWSVGATLGAAAAAAGSAAPEALAGTPRRRVLASIGDGSFQMTAQDVSTMMRYRLNPIIILVNNAGYTIEVEIHDGPYNIISNWDYVGLIKSMHNAHGGNAVGGDPDSLFAVRCRTESEFDAALEEAKGREDALCFIEVVVDKDDCSKELLEWGSRVAAANGRAPNPQ